MSMRVICSVSDTDKLVVTVCDGGRVLLYGRDEFEALSDAQLEIAHDQLAVALLQLKHERRARQGR